MRVDFMSIIVGIVLAILSIVGGSKYHIWTTRKNMAPHIGARLENYVVEMSRLAEEMEHNNGEMDFRPNCEYIDSKLEFLDQYGIMGNEILQIHAFVKHLKYDVEKMNQEDRTEKNWEMNISPVILSAFPKTSKQSIADALDNIWPHAQQLSADFNRTFVN